VTVILRIGSLRFKYHVMSRLGVRHYISLDNPLVNDGFASEELDEALLHMFFFIGKTLPIAAFDMVWSNNNVQQCSSLRRD
jgi:hypothetical protein